MSARIEHIWPAWRVVGFIDAGSFGKVYRVLKEQSGTTASAAVKVIEIPPSRDEISVLMSKGMDSVEIFDRYSKEVQSIAKKISLMEQLKGNPYIVHIEDFEVHEHEDGSGWTICMRMELLTSLITHIRDSGNLDKEEVMRLGHDICHALSACEEHKIVHRDVKPSNIFVGKDGRFKLGDFGIAEFLDSDIRRQSISKMGASAYMAPEVFDGGDYNQTADIYSLAMVMYRLLDWNNQSSYALLGSATARANFWDAEKESERMRLNGHALPLPADAQGRLGKVILRALDADPTKRYQSAKEFCEAIEACEQDADEQPNATLANQMEACLEQGIARYTMGDYAKAVELLEVAHEAGLLQATAYLGRCYLAGTGATRDLRKGFDLLLMAARGGDARAAYDVGVCYRDALGVEGNASEAFSWFDHGGSAGNLQAMLATAECYEEGLGVVEDKYQALMLYSQVSRSDAGELGARARAQEEKLRASMDNAEHKGLSGWLKRLFGKKTTRPTASSTQQPTRPIVQPPSKKDRIEDGIETVVWEERLERPPLVDIEWKSTGRTFSLHDEGREITIGRYGCDITLDTDNYLISRRHARFVFDAGRVFLVDNTSSNGTYLNGERIAANKWYPLAFGDTFSLADEVFTVKEPHANG
jgi:tetratricopeptide (TPR) repeat protein